MGDGPAAHAPLAEEVQRAILDCRSAVPEGVQLHLNPHGVWLTAEAWPDAEQMGRLVGLCETLVRGCRCAG